MIEPIRIGIVGIARICIVEPVTNVYPITNTAHPIHE